MDKSFIINLTINLIIWGTIIYFIVKFFRKKIKKNTPNFYKIYTPNGLQFVKKLEELEFNNESISYSEPLKIYNQMFNTNFTTQDQLENAIGIGGYIDLPENTLKFIAGDYVDGIQWNLFQRNSAEFFQLKAIDEKEAMKQFGLNIYADEFIHDNINKVDWYEEKTITNSISYGGFQFRTGSGGMTYRMGNLRVVPLTTQKFVPIDRGTIFITNKRIIFVGAEKRVNKTINLDDIIEFGVFRDGILIGKANGKKPLIHFPEYINQSNKAPKKRDHLNRIMRVLNRVISKTQFENIGK